MGFFFTSTQVSLSLAVSLSDGSYGSNYCMLQLSLISLSPTVFMNPSLSTHPKFIKHSPLFGVKAKLELFARSPQYVC